SAVVDRDGALFDLERTATPATLEDIVGTIVGSVRALGERFPTARGVGIGAAGLVDRDGMVHYAPNIPAFVRAPLRQLVGDALGAPVVVDNDANVAALGELTHGAARGHAEVLCITLGTGIGGGVITGGTVLRGAHG